MRNKSIFAIIIAVVMLLAFYSSTTSSGDSEVSASTVEDSTKIYLYGEEHHIKKINDKEFELWQGYYNDQGMRHLFVELSYYEAECLNLWMQSDNDEISDLLYEYNPSEFEYDFYKEIKKECPETVFHGTDIGFKVTSGYKYYMEYLEKNNMKDTEQYKLCLEAIDQGKAFHKCRELSYRENKMVENFIREFDKLDGESVMGIYGCRHTDIDALNFDYTVPCMGNQLNQHYEGMVFSEDLSTPPRIDTIKVNNKEYEASYFGKEEMPWTEEYDYVEIWRLENAFDDFKEMTKTDNVIPYDGYPMILKDGQVFVRKAVKTDGSVIKSYYISDGHVWNGKLSTEEIIIEE